MRRSPSEPTSTRATRIGFSLFFGVMAILAGWAAVNGSALMWAYAAVSFWLAGPWYSLTRRVFVACGWYRALYVTSWATCWLTSYSRAGEPVLMSAWALLRRPHPRPTQIAWVEARMRSRLKSMPKYSFSAADVAAMGLLELLQGRPEEARGWLDSLGSWSRRTLNDEVVWTARAARARLFPAALLSSVPPLPEAADGVPGIHSALRAQLSLEGNRPSLEQVAHVAAMWKHAIESEALALHLASRSAALGAGQDDTLNTLRQLALEALQAALPDTAAPERTDGLPPLLVVALRQRRDARLEVLEERVAQLRALKDRNAPLEPTECWRLIQQVLAAYHACARDDRTMAFEILFGPLCNIAVWLFNTQLQTAMGNALFTLLATEARQVGDEAALSLSLKNAAVGY